MDPLSMLLGAVAVSALWAISSVAGSRSRQPQTSSQECIAQWTVKRTDWFCTNVAHPSCRSQRCRRHCKSDLCGCLTEDRLETEVLKELRAVTKERR